MDRRSEPPDISVVVPVYRGARSLEELVRRVRSTLDGEGKSWELILVNDGSPDDSDRVIEALCRAEKRVIGMLLAKNHGQHYATLCGLKQARGHWTITLDDDLQHPPEEIPKLLEGFREGLEIVIGSHEQQRQGVFRRLTSRAMQFLLSRMLKKPKTLQLTSFRCLSRKARTLIAQYHGIYPYLPALMFNAVPTDRVANVMVEHAPRAQGKSSYSFRQLLHLASFLLINHSKLLLRLVVVAGVLLAALAVIVSFWFVTRYLLYRSQPVGWTSLAVLTTFFSGMVLISLGVIGEYIGRIIDQTDKVQSYQVYRKFNA